MATAHYDYIYTIYVRHSRSMFDQMMCRIFDIVIDTLICDIIEIIALLIIPTMNTNNAYVYIYIYIYNQRRFRSSSLLWAERRESCVGVYARPPSHLAVARDLLVPCSVVPRHPVAQLRLPLEARIEVGPVAVVPLRKRPPRRTRRLWRRVDEQRRRWRLVREIRVARIVIRVVRILLETRVDALLTTPLLGRAHANRRFPLGSFSRIAKRRLHVIKGEIWEKWGATYGRNGCLGGEKKKRKF